MEQKYGTILEFKSALKKCSEGQTAKQKSGHHLKTVGSYNFQALCVCVCVGGGDRGRLY